MTEPEELEVEVEIDVEHEWRCDQLEKIGFTRYQAFRLSVNGADWHKCKSMLDAGASHEAVLEILI